MAKEESLIDALLAWPGRYLGVGRDLGEEHRFVARIVVTPLPGRSAVSLDYEAFSTDNVTQHAEHSVLARTPTGAVLVVAHSHGDTTAVLHETDPGFFVAAADASPFPMAIRVEVPELGRLTYNWHFGRPGGPLEQHDVTELQLVR